MTTLPISVTAALASWALNDTGVSTSPYSGAGIRIALVDTGFQHQHPDFGSRPIKGQSFVAGEDPLDRLGHGTHCGALACGPVIPVQYPRYGVAAGAEMWVLKVFDANGATTPMAVQTAIDTAIIAGAEIICLPLGERVGWNVPYIPTWEAQAQRALATGTLILAAAGDESDRRTNVRWPVDHPANCPSIVAVGAVDASSQVAWFSNGGSNGAASGVDVAAPGGDIFSASVAPAWYRVMSGTSQAVALAAGIAALHAQKTGRRGAALRDLLLETAKPLPDCDSHDVGAGLVQAPI